MKKRVETLYLIGAVLAIVGSFLPWWCEGDMIWRCYKGISLSPWVDNWLQDNGGLLIVLLSAVVVGLAFRPPRFVKRTAIWNMVFGATITLLSAYYAGRWLVWRMKWAGAVGAPVIRIGLVIVVLGSVILLSVTLAEYRQKYGSI